MSNELFLIHVAGIILAGTLSALVGYWIHCTFDRPAAGWMARLLFVLSGWSMVTILQLLSTSKMIKIIFFLIGKPLGKATFILWFIFVLVFTGREYWLTDTVRQVLVGSWLFITIITITNPFHGLLWSEFRINDTGFASLYPVETPLEMTIMAVAGLLALTGMGLLIRSLHKARHVTKSQLTVVTLGFVLAIPSAVLDIVYSLPIPGFEYGQINAMIFFVAIAVAVFRYDLFVVGPFARASIFNALDEGIVVLDANGNIIDYNLAATEIFPEIENSLGEHHSTKIPNGILDKSTDKNNQEGFDLAQTIHRSVDGERHRYAVDVSPLSYRGFTRGYAIVLRDQTEIEQYVNRLERQAERLDDFASTVSHDLRNPLMVANGQLSLARETGDSDAFERVNQAHERMEEIIDDALSLARSSDRGIEKEMVSIDEIISEAWAQVQSDKATLDNSQVSPGRLVYADAQRLQTVFENLFRNAIEHGSKSVRVRVVVNEEGIIVEDDGPGIPEDQREKIFNRGFTTGEHGTGLGLSIVQQIIEGHGWEINIAESKDGGARFEINI